MSASVLIALASIAALLPGAACVGAAIPSGFHGPPPGAAQADEILEGYLEVLIEDADRGSRTLYFLISREARIPLRFAADPPNVTTGTRVRVQGGYDTEGTFVVATLEKLPEG